MPNCRAGYVDEVISGDDARAVSEQMSGDATLSRLRKPDSTRASIREWLEATAPPSVCAGRGRIDHLRVIESGGGLLVQILQGPARR